MAGKSKILIIGGTGYIGRFIVDASVRAGHPTFLLVRHCTIYSPSQSDLIQRFRDSGVTFFTGDLNDHKRLVNAIKQVDVVISAVGFPQLNDQEKIVAAIIGAIKHFGNNVKRFFPSEFENHVDRVQAVEPATSVFEKKAQLRQLIEESGIPYTYISSNLFANIFFRRFGQPDLATPPTDRVIILGDGNAKAAYSKEEDVATYIIRAVDDPRTLNKILYIRPPANTISMNDLVSLWERKISKRLERVYVPEEEILKGIQEAKETLSVMLGVWHSIYGKGDQTNFEIEPGFGVEASHIYSDVIYSTVDEMLDQYINQVSERQTSRGNTSTSLQKNPRLKLLDI